MAEKFSPIFIVGPGRSGTTLTLDLLSLHSELAWFSGWTNRFPEFPQLAALNRLNHYPLLEKVSRPWPKWPRPAEAYNIWNYYFPGFSQADNDWKQKEPNPENAQQFIQFMKGHCRWQGRPRFLTKYTGWPRICFLHTFLPQAKFIYIDRDPRAVVSSYMKQRWRLKNKPDQYEAMKEKERLTFYSKMYLAYYEAKSKYQPNQDYHQIYYEDLISNTIEVLAQICAYVSISCSKYFEILASSWAIYSHSNEAWKVNLNQEEQQYLTELLQEPLSQMGYLQ